MLGGIPQASGMLADRLPRFLGTCLTCRCPAAAANISWWQELRSVCLLTRWWLFVADPLLRRLENDLQKQLGGTKLNHVLVNEYRKVCVSCSCLSSTTCHWAITSSSRVDIYSCVADDGVGVADVGDGDCRAKASCLIRMGPCTTHAWLSSVSETVPPPCASPRTPPLGRSKDHKNNSSNDNNKSNSSSGRKTRKKAMC